MSSVGMLAYSSLCFPEYQNSQLVLSLSGLCFSPGSSNCYVSKYIVQLILDEGSGGFREGFQEGSPKSGRPPLIQWLPSPCATYSSGGGTVGMTAENLKAATVFIRAKNGGVSFTQK